MPSRRYWRGILYTNLWRLRALARRPWSQILSTLGIVAVVCLISYAIPSARPQTTQAGSTSKTVITVSTEHPDEAPVSAAYHSTATGTEPASLSLPSINATGYIQKVGVDQNHQVAVPTNIHLAGWFVESVTPGDPGLSIIDGHLDGYRKPGIFAQLGRLKAGDIFTVTLATGVIRRFRTASVQSLPTAQAAALLFSQTPGITRQLNLITCGGTFNTSAGAYDHRVIVTAAYTP